MTRVKICGLTRAEDVAAVNKHKADFAGFVFATSRRRVEPETAKRLIASLDPSIVPVGVFVNGDAASVARIAEACALRAVQLHGEENNEYIAKLRKQLPAGVIVIKAVRVRDATSLALAEGIDCDLLLLDAYSADAAGGVGKTFDWNCIKAFGRPYLLAGGLNAGNVEEAVALLHLFGVDVSSGVETDGAKDEARIAEFIRLAGGGQR